VSKEKLSGKELEAHEPSYAWRPPSLSYEIRTEPTKGVIDGDH
jgi:hypothetical protein